MTDIDVRTTGRPTSLEVKTIEETLMSAAFHEFTEHGYAGASLTRVVARARMSKTTLYSRYPSKEALFNSLIQQQINSYKPFEALQACTEPLSVSDDLERFAVDILNLSFEPRIYALNRVIVAEVHRFPALAQAAEVKLQRAITRVARYLEANSNRSGHSILDADAVAESYVHMLQGWYLHRLFGGRPPTDDEVRNWARKAIRALICPAPCW